MYNKPAERDGAKSLVEVNASVKILHPVKTRRPLEMCKPNPAPEDGGEAYPQRMGGQSRGNNKPPEKQFPRFFLKRRPGNFEDNDLQPGAGSSHKNSSKLEKREGFNKQASILDFIEE